METRQPLWTRIANLGDVNPIEYGGFFVYVDRRGLNARYLGCSHDGAVVAQNRVARALRKALGFSYPQNDITFLRDVNDNAVGSVKVTGK